MAERPTGEEIAWIEAHGGMAANRVLVELRRLRGIIADAHAYPVVAGAWAALADEARLIREEESRG